MTEMAKAYPTCNAGRRRANGKNACYLPSPPIFGNISSIITKILWETDNATIHHNFCILARGHGNFDISRRFPKIDPKKYGTIICSEKFCGSSGKKIFSKILPLRPQCGLLVKLRYFSNLAKIPQFQTGLHL